MIPLSFVKTLKRSSINGQFCFVYHELDDGKENTSLWTELKQNKEVIVLNYDLQHVGGQYITIYYFTFADEGLAETYKEMLDL